MNKNKLKAYLAIASFTASLIFGLLGFFAVPVGELSPTVLIYIGQMLLFTATLLGFSTSDNQLLKELTELVKDLKKD